MVSAAKGGRCQALRDFAIRFGLQRRDALPFGLILKAPDKVLFWESIGGLRLIIQQIAHRIVVLTVR